MTASTKDLIERARDAARIAPNGAFLRELAVELKRLTQPVGEVEPVCYHSGLGETSFDVIDAGKHGWPALYSAATVTSLIAERDAANSTIEAYARDIEKGVNECVKAGIGEHSPEAAISLLAHQRDALQERVKTLQGAVGKAAEAIREFAEECDGDYELAEELDALTAELSELRAQKQTCNDKEIVANDDGSALLHAIEAQKGRS